MTSFCPCSQILFALMRLSLSREFAEKQVLRGQEPFREMLPILVLPPLCVHAKYGRTHSSEARRFLLDEVLRRGEQRMSAKLSAHVINGRQRARARVSWLAGRLDDDLLRI